MQFNIVGRNLKLFEDDIILYMRNCTVNARIGSCRWWCRPWLSSRGLSFGKGTPHCSRKWRKTKVFFIIILKISWIPSGIQLAKMYYFNSPFLALDIFINYLMTMNILTQDVFQKRFWLNCLHFMWINSRLEANYNHTLFKK